MTQPVDSLLDRAYLAFDRGDFRGVRTLCTRVLGEDRENARAQELLARLASDRSTLLAAVAGLLFFVAVTAYYLSR